MKYPSRIPCKFSFNSSHIFPVIPLSFRIICCSSLWTDGYAGVKSTNPQYNAPTDGWTPCVNLYGDSFCCWTSRSSSKHKVCLVMFTCLSREYANLFQRLQPLLYPPLQTSQPKKCNKPELALIPWNHDSRLNGYGCRLLLSQPLLTVVTTVANSRNHPVSPLEPFHS